MQVNRDDFDEETSLQHATFYSDAIGRMPHVGRRDLQTVWIHDGDMSFGGGNNNILIHIGAAERYINWWRGNVLHEALMHESTHTSIDRYLYGTHMYDEAQKDDDIFVSDYARDHP